MPLTVHIVLSCRTIGDIREALGGLVTFNMIHLSKHATPLLYEAGVRYISQPPPERFKTIPFVIAAGGGDCDQLCGWRIAELRVRGERATEKITRRGRLWHVQVVRGNGVIEDPSVRLGMRG